jgi:hypothetical protein
MPQIPEQQLPHLLRFDPEWIKDPVPWILQYLEKEAAISAALIRVDLQRQIYTAQAKAMEQLHGILQKEQQRR